MDITGGQATSISLDKSKYGADWMNNGVQGGSLVSLYSTKLSFNLFSPVLNRPQIFKHTFNFFKKYGHEPQEVKLQVAFGKGPDGFWTNCFTSPLVNQFSSDIKNSAKFFASSN